MRVHKEVIEELRVAPGDDASLGTRSTSETTAKWLDSLKRAHPQEVAERDLKGFRKDLSAVQELLYATDQVAVLVVLQALDAAGKDGTIKHVMSGVNPQGCSVASFKQPSREELGHDFLWRCSKALPERGRIGIFNRSYYEDVLVTRVHPDLLAAQHRGHEVNEGDGFWAKRHEDINAFEHHLDRSGILVVKLFLHISKEEQRRRFLKRIDDPAKQWKFSAADLAERVYFEEYQRYYEHTITATSTPWAPWYVIPADHKFAARALVGCVLVHAIEGLHLQLPKITPEQHAALEAARQTLLTEPAD